MNEKEVVKIIIEGKGVIVLDEETFDKMRAIFSYTAKEKKQKTNDAFPYRLYGIPVVWVEGGFKKLVGG